MLSNLILLFVMAIPIACISWTFTHEELFKELQDWLKHKQSTAKNLYIKKLYYLPTCDYCFSHYVTAIFVLATQYHLLFDGWQGIVMSFFSLVWVANSYISLFGRLRLDIKQEKLEIEKVETSPIP